METSSVDIDKKHTVCFLSMSLCVCVRERERDRHTDIWTEISRDGGLSKWG